jgi:hypothetical protein
MHDADEMTEGSRKRPRVEQGDSSVLTMCQACHMVDITAPQPHFSLFCEEKCLICAACFSRCSSDRQCQPFLVCPCCDSHRTQWEVKYTETSSASRSGNQRTISAAHQSATIEPNKIEDPVRYHQRMADLESVSGSSGADDFIGFSLTICKNRQVQAQSQMYRVGGDCNDWGEDQLHMLEDLFQHYHHMLITHDDLRQGVDINPHSPTPTARGLRSLASDDYSPLHRMVFMMAYGEHLGKHTPFEPKAQGLGFQKLVMTTFAATDMIRHVRAPTNNQGVLKAGVSSLLRAFSVSKDVYSILNELGVSASYQTVRRGNLKQYARKLQEGVEGGVGHLKFSKFSHMGNHFDNCGYFQGGCAERVGYLQTTLFFFVITGKLDMRSWSIYWDPERPDVTPLSRERKKWEEEQLKTDVGYESVLAPRTEDHERHASAILEVIDELLNMVKNETMFTYEDAEHMVENNSYEWIHKVTDLFGLQSLIEPADGGRIESVYVDVDDDTEGATHLDANNAFSDVPMQADLNKKSTCEAVIDYTALHQAAILEHEDLDEGWENERPILLDIPSVLACDGAPARMMKRMQLLNPERWIATIISGGFHMTLSSYKALGKMFGFSHLVDFFSLWRKTDGQLKWVMEPGDPNQIEDELIMMIFGLLIDAIMGLVATKRQNNPDVPFDISAVDVLDHMRSRAKMYPMVNLVLQTLPLAGMIFMMQQAEANADADCYMSAMRLLVNVFAASHQTGYVFLVNEFFRDWHCMSDAERVLFKKSFLFRKTKNGSNIFPDRFVEWCVRYIRQGTGKKAISADYINVVTQHALLLNERSKTKQSVKNQKPPDTEKGRKDQQLDKVCQEVLLMSRDRNNFGPGPPIYAPTKCWNDRRDMDRTKWEEVLSSDVCSDVYTPSGDKKVNPELLFYLSTGKKRSENYFTTFSMLGEPTKIERSEKENEGGVSLALIEGDMSKVTGNATDALERWVSLDQEFLEKRGVFVTEEVTKELKYLNSELGLGDKVVPGTNDRGNSTKSLKIIAIIEARQTLIAKDPGWVAKRQAKVLIESGGSGDASSAETFEERVERELESPFFSFIGTVARTTYAAKIYNFAAATASASASAAVPSPSPSYAHVGMSQGSDATFQSSQSTGAFAGRGISSLRREDYK